MIVSFERWGPLGFLLAGVGLLVGLLLAGLAVFGDWALEFAAAIPFFVGIPLAIAVGLFGLYPRVANHLPRTALAGGIAAMIASIGALALGVMGTLHVLTGFEPAGPLATVVLLAALGGLVVGLAVFAIAGWRTATPSRMIGGLLGLAALLLVLPLSDLLLQWGPPPDWFGFLVLGSVGVVLLGAGYLLRTGRELAGEEVERPLDPASR